MVINVSGLGRGALMQGIGGMRPANNNNGAEQARGSGSGRAGRGRGGSGSGSGRRGRGSGSGGRGRGPGRNRGADPMQVLGALRGIVGPQIQQVQQPPIPIVAPLAAPAPTNDPIGDRITGFINNTNAILTATGSQPVGGSLLRGLGF